MISFDNPGDAKSAVMRYAATATITDDLRLALIKIVSAPSPVTVVVDSAECLYARAGDLDDTGRALAANLASYAAEWGWHGMQTDDRGMRIAQAMRRVNGEDGVWPDAETDPVPSGRFVPVSMPVIPLL